MPDAVISELSTFGLREHRRDRAVHVALWIGQITLALGFLLAGFAKLSLTVAELAVLVPWATAVPEPVIRIAGAAELAGALGLVLPSLTGIRPGLTPLAALGLAIAMALAVGFHIDRGDAGAAVLPAVVAGIAGAIAIGRWRISPIAPRRPPPLPDIPA
jgi:putative oxidoreductase